MKSKGYKLDFISNTIVITKKFAKEASELNSPAYKMMMELRSLDLPITVSRQKKHKNKSKITYAMMKKHINCLSEKEAYLAEFEAVKEAACAEKNAYLYVLNWYEATFPNHENVPQFNEKNQIVNTPAHYDA